MECYISQDYFAKLEELLISAKEDIFSGKATNLNVIFQLLSALPLNIDIEDRDIENAKALVGNKVYTSFKDRIITNAINNVKLNNSYFKDDDTKINNLSAFYFMNSEQTEGFSKKNGVVCKGNEYKGESFYEDCTVVNLPIKGDWAPIINSIPPVNAMLIIDRYIFGKPFSTKLESLLNLIKLYKGDLTIPFHLSILFSSEGKKNGTINTTSSQIKYAFDELSKIKNIEIRIYSDKNIPIDDRLIFTNYTSGNIGHPLVKKETRFTQNFLGGETSSEKIRQNYKIYREDLLNWNSFLNGIPSFLGTVQTIWETSEFNNRLFQPFI